jgi:hypothetical protein
MLNPTSITRWANQHSFADAPQADFPRQDADYQGTFSFTKQDDWGVLDNNTGLLWEVSTGAACAFDQAQAYANQLNTTTPGYWRVPTINELESIVDFSGVSPAIDAACFPNTIANAYWSATPDVATSGSLAWAVGFRDGVAYRLTASTLLYVRLVHGEKKTSTYTRQGEVVIDSLNGLMWKHTHEMIDPSQPNDSQTLVNALSWQQALQVAVNDRTGGFSDWRLPNIKELRSLIDEAKFRPALDPAFMSPPSQAWFWSSSPYMGDSGGQGWSHVVYSETGQGQAVLREFNQYARLVRTMQPGEIVAPTPVIVTPTPTPAPVPTPTPVPTPVVTPPSGETLAAFKARLTAYINA